MRPGRDGLFLGAAAVVAAAVVLGGGFEPIPRLVLGVLLAGVAAWAAIAVGGRLLPEEWLGLAAVGWGGVSAALASGYPFAARQVVGGWLAAWLIWVVARRTPAERRRSVMLLVAVATVAVGAAVIAECIAAGRIRTGGVFANPNVTAALLAPAVPVVWHLLSGRWWRGAAAVTVALAALATALTGSRAGLLGLVLVAGLMLPRGRARAMGLGLLMVLAGTLILWRFASSPDSLAWHRVQIWRALAPLVADHWLTGVGPGWLEEATGPLRIAHDEAVGRWGRVIGGAESTPFGLVIRTGLPGLALALAAAIVWWRRVRRQPGMPPPAILPALVGMAAIALFHDLLDEDVVLWWWALLAGVAGTDDRDQAAGAEVRRAPRLALAVASAFALAWTIATPALARAVWSGGPPSAERAARAQRVDPWFADPLAWRVDALLAEPGWRWEDAAAAISSGRRSVDLHPGSARAWARLGGVYGRVAAELGPWPDVLAGARASFERATELEPHLPWYWLRWALFERSIGQLDEAEELARRAVAEEPDFVRGQLALARIALDRGEPTAARLAYERAREAAALGRRRDLTGYERDLLAADAWQVEQVAGLLAEAAGGS